MTNELFELLEKRGITDGHSAAEVIEKVDYEELLNLALDCFSAISAPSVSKDQKIFRFAPISSIAGGPTPCSSIPCRIEAAYSLSLIGGLYADQLVIPNFFDYMFEVIHGEVNPPDTDEEVEAFAYRLAGDIAVCFIYKPLFEANLATMNFTVPTVCKNCHNRHLKESDDFHKQLKQVLKTVEPKLKKKVRFVYDGGDYIDAVNEDNYLGGQLGWTIKNDLLHSMQKHQQEAPYTLSMAELKKFGLLDAIIDSSVNDILEYDFYPSLNGATYLTNRQFDMDLIQGTSKHSGSAKLTNVFPVYHEVPYLEDILLEDLVSLRKKEADVFQVYRDAVAELVNKDDEQQAKAYFVSTIEPAINKIQNVVSDNKKRYRARAGRKIKVRSVLAAASIGTANLLGLPLEATGGVVGAAGLFTSNDIIDDFQTSKEIPIEAKENSFYFLWDIKRGHA